MEPFLFDFDDTELKKQRRMARDLKQSQWWKRQCAKGKCHYCGNPTPPKELTMDHIVPLSRGGKSTRGNVVPCCKACNNKKKYLLLMELEKEL